MLNIIDLEDKKTDNEYQLKKKKILRIVLNSEYIQNKNLIFTFLLGDTLDNYINSLDDNKVNIKINTVIKKGYFTSEEQFLSILDSFITYLSNINKKFASLMSPTTSSVAQNLFYAQN